MNTALLDNGRTAAFLEDGGSLIDLLRIRAEGGDSAAYIFLRNGDDPSEPLTSRTLLRIANGIAVKLMEHKLKGEPILLIYNCGLEFIAAFWGCLLSGNIAVPVAPPRGDQRLGWLTELAANSGARAVLTDGGQHTRLKAGLPVGSILSRLPWIETDLAVGPDTIAGPAIRRDAVAVLQYTSGSTGRPKGVVLTHDNIIANEDMICRAFNHAEGAATVVGCLPHFHDMGLFGNLLQPLYLGSLCVFMSPEAFVQRPQRWLKAISDYRGTTSGGPNFVYDLCATRIQPGGIDLDLSSWSVAFVGAEPIRPATLKRFAEVFEPYGFRREAFFPCYGLAEATLFVAGGNLSPGAPWSVQGPRGTEVMTCGPIVEPQKLIVVNPETWLPQPAGQEGEIWLRGPNVANGYWQNPVSTQGTFGGLTAEGDGPFTRTGDLGFVQDGNLFVTGRIKTIIIVDGNNLHSEDLEAVAGHAHGSIAAGACAAVAAPGASGEEIVIIAEIRRAFMNNLDSVLVGDLVHRKIAETFGVAPRAVVFVRAGGIPRTSSGKIRREACCQALLAGELPEFARWQRIGPSGADQIQMSETAIRIRGWLVATIAERQGLLEDEVATTDPFPVLGLDSKDVFELAYQLSAWLGREFDPIVFWENPTIDQLACGLAEIDGHL
ncbi:acyl-CoA synthetase (AMP-forming)/AMP-acid ligase II [Nitrospirillum amazonense]|uniref:Acyl-CoA synthetase (AMP-forming)/AMP-acid ligase II n=1 Tax=Nitrospirillum amazonense TaxID=28077 RepID=A0A560ESP8_9PROT|nr:AMP-binding protein [Nitrospirillum amazonense]TWB12394.1 acyl-CoA synthetase (AMP-forming)/AMP-acid ligase II [Nitrospirillum amazonense]